MGFRSKMGELQSYRVRIIGVQLYTIDYTMTQKIEPIRMLEDITPGIMYVTLIVSAIYFLRHGVK